MGGVRLLCHTAAGPVFAEIRFLYNFQVRLERLQRMVRDLNGTLEPSGGRGGYDLEWVIAVHEVTRESDDLFRTLTSLRLPESQREQYEYLYVGMLEVVQVAGYGSDRLLAAAVLVGPSGRTAQQLGAEDADRFHTLLREARFFLSDATGRIDREVEEVGRSVGGLSLR